MNPGGLDPGTFGFGGGQAGDGGPSQQQQKEAFLTQAASVEPYLSKPILTPISKYELKAGSVIPGALLTAINTDLPGEVIGQVTENVFDSATGNYLLIPQGSKLLGKYQSEVANGQNRALVVWQRLDLSERQFDRFGWHAGDGRSRDVRPAGSGGLPRG